MKFIKQLSILLFIPILTIAFGGCAEKEAEKEAEQELIIEFEDPIVLEVSSNPDEGKHANEYAPWNYDKQEIERIEAAAPKTFTVKFDDTKYTCDFSYALKIRPETYVTLHYHRDNVSFQINADTKEMIGFSLSKSSTANQALDESACRKIADDFAGKYIDVSKYKVSVENDADRNNCRFSYEREISGIRTAEVIYVTVDGDGDVIYFFSRMLHDFDNVITVNLNDSKITDAIDTKVASIYEDVDNYEGYTVRNRVLTKLEDGSFGFMYLIDCNFEKIYFEDGSYLWPKTPMTLLVRGTAKHAE